MSGLTEQERAELLEYLTEWQQTCRAMGVPFTPASIAEWLTDSTEFLPRVKAAARAEVLAKVEAQFDDFAGEVARTCCGPNAEVMPTDRAVVRSLIGRLRASVAELGGVS